MKKYLGMIILLASHFLFAQPGQHNYSQDNIVCYGGRLNEESVYLRTSNVGNKKNLVVMISNLPEWYSVVDFDPKPNLSVPARVNVLATDDESEQKTATVVVKHYEPNLSATLKISGPLTDPSTPDNQIDVYMPYCKIIRSNH